MYDLFLKRLLDLTIALIIFISFIPLLVIITLVLALINGESPFFTQDRPGKHGVLFKIFKFKTLKNVKEATDPFLHDIDRFNRGGKFLRYYSLDELPQLLNVIKGDMSLVGPRPLLVEYLPRYTLEQKRRHEVKPGITGWAQVNGRDELSIPDKVALDVEYLNRQSFWFDMKILWMTFLRVMKRDGVSH